MYHWRIWRKQPSLCLASFKYLTQEIPSFLRVLSPYACNNPWHVIQNKVNLFTLVSLYSYEQIKLAQHKVTYWQFFQFGGLRFPNFQLCCNKIYLAAKRGCIPLFSHRLRHMLGYKIHIIFTPKTMLLFWRTAECESFMGYGLNQIILDNLSTSEYAFHTFLFRLNKRVGIWGRDGESEC